MQGYPVTQADENFEHSARTPRPTRQSGNPIISGFNGLRGIAVVFVMLYHWFPHTVRGGFLGVSIFLCLSGYLITDSFLRTWRREQSLQIGSFYMRRLRRIYPPLIFFLLILSTWIIWLQPTALLNYRGNLLSTLGGFNNWWQIAQNLSYFEVHGSVNPLTHMWTMGLEMQFYFIWPWLLLPIVWLGKRHPRQAVFFACGVLALLSFAAMVVLYALNFPLTRVYYGTDTRAFSFFLGGMLAGLLSSRRLAGLTDYLSRRTVDRIGLPAFLAVFALLIFLPGDRAVSYYFGIFAFSLLTALLMFCTSDRRSFFGRLFSFRPLQALGRRSYSLYLWQYAIMIIFRDQMKFVKISYYLNVFIQLLVVLLLAECSYRLVEVNWSRTARFLLRPISLRHSYENRNRKLTPHILALLLVICLFASTITALVKAPVGQADYTVELKERIQNPAARLTREKPSVEVEVGSPLGLDVVKRLMQGEQSEVPSPADPIEQPDPTETDASSPPVTSEIALTAAEAELIQNLPLTCIGDSLAESAKYELQEIIPNITVDGLVSRQFPDGISLLREMREAGTLQKDILYMLGTNGVINDAMMTELCTEFADYNLYFLDDCGAVCRGRRTRQRNLAKRE